MKMPALVPVTSSNIDALGFSPHIGLVVRFKGGGLYHYPEVPLAVYEQALEAPSVGRWFSNEIRGKYKHSQVDK